jgi:hypothetical protein
MCIYNTEALHISTYIICTENNKWTLSYIFYMHIIQNVIRFWAITGALPTEFFDNSGPLLLLRFIWIYIIVYEYMSAFVVVWINISTQLNSYYYVVYTHLYCVGVFEFKGVYWFLVANWINLVSKLLVLIKNTKSSIPKKKKKLGKQKKQVWKNGKSFNRVHLFVLF